MGWEVKLFAAVIALVLLGDAIWPCPPHRVWINGEHWDVIYLPERQMVEVLGMPYAGFTFCEDRTILISKDEDPGDWPDTLLHEAAHAATCDSDGDVHNDAYDSPPTGDHPGIERIAQEELRFMQENPRAVLWIEATR